MVNLNIEKCDSFECYCLDMYNMRRLYIQEHFQGFVSAVRIAPGMPLVASL